MREVQHGHSWDPNSSGGKVRQRSRQTSMTASGWEGRESRESLRETRESSRGRQQQVEGGRLVVTLRESPGSRSSSRTGGEEERNQAVKEVRGIRHLHEDRREGRRAEDIWKAGEVRRVEPRRDELCRRGTNVDIATESGSHFKSCLCVYATVIIDDIARTWSQEGSPISFYLSIHSSLMRMCIKLKSFEMVDLIIGPESDHWLCMSVTHGPVLATRSQIWDLVPIGTRLLNSLVLRCQAKSHIFGR